MKQLLLVLLLLGTFAGWAQGPAEAELVIKDEFYNNKPLLFVLTDLKKKYNVKVDYDEELVKKYRVSYWFDNTKFLEGLKGVLRDTKELTLSLIHI